MQFLSPIIKAGDVRIILRSGGAAELFEALKSLALDTVLTTEPPHAGQGVDFTAHRIDEQSVGSVVLADEFASGLVRTAPFDPQIAERFYAVTVKRSFPHPVIKQLFPK